jgi:hypothetical protein
MGRTLEKLGPALYSPECVEVEFCELRTDFWLKPPPSPGTAQEIANNVAIDARDLYSDD